MFLALFGALLIGLSLGLLGSGGSILTVPVLVFILGRPEKVAVAESLAIVGSVAVVGAIQYAIRKEINWKYVVFFGVPGMLGACTGGCSTYFISGALQLTLFAITMLAASYAMLFGPSLYENLTPRRFSPLLTMIKGFSIGLLTGLIGVGGGFLIVPALIILCGLSMTTAVGTSLVIIAMNTWSGFLEQLVVFHYLDLQVNWSIIGMIATLAIIGCLAGAYLSKFLPQNILRKILGFSIFVMALLILWMER